MKSLALKTFFYKIKIIKKLIIFTSLLIATIYLSSAIDIVLTSGTKLDNFSWDNLSSVLNKVDINSGNININGKLAVDGKICDTNDNCLGECETIIIGIIFLNTCISDIKNCYITNGTGEQTWDGNDWGVCTLISCNSGYVENGGVCVFGTAIIRAITRASFSAYNRTAISCTAGGFYINLRFGKNSVIYRIDYSTDNQNTWNLYKNVTGARNTNGIYYVMKKSGKFYMQRPHNWGKACIDDGSNRYVLDFPSGTTHFRLVGS